MVGSLGAGLSHEGAARFSFLLATPVILGAGVLEAPRLLHAGSAGVLGPALLGGAVAAVAAWCSTAFLLRYFGRAGEPRALQPFAFYSLVAGLAALVLLRG
jgi:undecaprenyl-diphosphatase